jgi:DNA repair protein RecO (recombination protein O)
MPTYQTTGIVLGRTNFGEADRILRVLTPDKGKISVMAKGVRRIKSRSGGHLELFGEVTLTLATGRNLDVLTQARLKWYPHHLADDYQRLGLAFLMAQATDRLTTEGHATDGIYWTFLEAIHAVEDGATGALPELWYKLRLISLTGLQPELNGCVICSRHDDQSVYSFSPEKGGIVCQADSTALDRPMTKDHIKLWRLLSAHNYDSVAKISGSPMLAQETLPLCDLFYEHHVGKSFHSTMSHIA